MLIKRRSRSRFILIVSRYRLLSVARLINEWGSSRKEQWVLLCSYLDPLKAMGTLTRFVTQRHQHKELSSMKEMTAQALYWATAYAGNRDPRQTQCHLTDTHTQGRLQGAAQWSLGPHVACAWVSQACMVTGRTKDRSLRALPRATNDSLPDSACIHVHKLSTFAIRIFKPILLILIFIDRHNGNRATIYS